MWTRLRHRLGRRGCVLLFFGSLDLVYAVSIAAPGPQAARNTFFIWMLSIAPRWMWALLWTSAAVACLVDAFRRRDRVGYTAAVTINVLWGLISLGGWASGDVERGYVSAAIWLGMGGLLAVISGWPEIVDEDGRPTWTQPSS